MFKNYLYAAIAFVSVAAVLCLTASWVQLGETRFGHNGTGSKVLANVFGKKTHPFDVVPKIRLGYELCLLAAFGTLLAGLLNSDDVPTATRSLAVKPKP